MKIQRVRGTRDFYPEDVAVRNAIFDAWRRVSIRNGFAEYDGPLLEHLDLYRAKSGEELVGQIFTLNSRAGEELALRPEMTPTLARMINARVQSLPRPVKWFSIGPFYRGERPQRGRLREFYQWNIDIVGSDDLLADAECLFVVADLLREIGLTASDVVIRINDRRLMSAIFRAVGIPAEHHAQAFAWVDKADKMDPGALAAAWNESLGSFVSFDALWPLLAIDSWAALQSSSDRVLARADVEDRRSDVGRLFSLIQDFGITEFCDFSMRVVRGLAYYTGVVFEVFDRKGARRALCGGGRYDNLLAALGGPNVSGVGFGMGDVILTELLEDRHLTPPGRGGLDVFVVVADESARSEALRLVAGLRGRGVVTDFSYRRSPVGKQMAVAASRGAARCAIVGTETRERQCVSIKEMTTGRQVECRVEAFLAEPMAPLGEASEG